VHLKLVREGDINARRSAFGFKAIGGKGIIRIADCRLPIIEERDHKILGSATPWSLRDFSFVGLNRGGKNFWLPDRFRCGYSIFNVRWVAAKQQIFYS